MITFYIIWSLWFISEITLNLALRRESADKKDRDKNTIAIIWRILGISNTLAILSAIFIKVPISQISIFPYLGVMIIALGMVIRIIAIITLGKFFTVNVAIRDNHRVIQSGLYKYIRHPAYLGAIMSFVGFGVSLNNWISLAIISIFVSGVMIYRLRIEEKVLIEQFGEEYKEYMKRTFRLIPWIY
jgi:protein-S-isoprenylcysteine O-methyltransferase Ste14